MAVSGAPSRTGAADLERLIEETGAVEALPEVVQRALAVLRDPNSDPRRLAAVIASDQALTVRLLRIANSAFLARDRRVASVQEAILRVGYRTVQSLLLTASAASFLQRDLPIYRISRQELWLHGLAAALIARELAQRHAPNLIEEAYLAGLLHEVGKIALERHRSLALRAAIRWVNAQTPLWAAEERALGYHHGQVGERLTARWSLPEPVGAAIGGHHQPSRAPESGLALLTHFGHVLATGVTAPTTGATEAYRCSSDAAAVAALRLSAGERGELLRSVERTLRAYLTGECD